MIFDLIRQIGIWAAVDVFVMAVIIYRILLMIRGTRTMQMALGILFFYGAALLLSRLYPLTAISWLTEKINASVLIITVILFQDDIRRFLSRMGKKRFLSGTETISSQQIIDEITRAASSLAQKRLGAIIVIERNIILSRYMEVGTKLDALISKELLLATFHHASPIHDGAVVVQQGRIAAAGCFLPLTRREDVDPDMGTRHRAGIGISEDTDAIVILVSEEKGTISLAVDGKVSRDIDGKELRKALRSLMASSTEDWGDQKSSNQWAILERLKIFARGDRR